MDGYSKVGVVGMKKFCCVIGLLVSSVLMFSGYAWAELRLGVLAPRGELKAKTRWDGFAQYLAKQTATPVVLVPLRPPKVVQAANSGAVDLVLSHAAHTVYIVQQLQAVPLATINGKAGSQFAGVILAKKGSGITTAEDLRGKKVMSLKFNAAAGAYIFQTYHLSQVGIDPHKDFASLKEGKKQDDLVLAVRAGLIDAAFVRSGLIEAMAREGKINLEEFVVVDQRTGDGFDLLHTTDLYPEWYISALPVVAGSLADKVRTASLSVSGNSEVVRQAKIRGFVDPLSLTPMENALRHLKIAPFNDQ